MRGDFLPSLCVFASLREEKLGPRLRGNDDEADTGPLSPMPAMGALAVMSATGGMQPANQVILMGLGGRNHSMARLVFGMNQSLDGYVDHMEFAPSPVLFRHFIEEAEGQAGSVYGRQMYEVMRYWDDDHPEWGAEEQAFAAAWRNQPKWVVSCSLKSVGPNARLVEDDLEGAIREQGRARRRDR